MKVIRSATGSCAHTRNGAAISTTRDATPTHARIARRRRSVVVPTMRGLRSFARRRLCGGEAPSRLASWLATSGLGAFAIVLLCQAAFRCSEERSIDARWRIVKCANGALKLDDARSATGSTVRRHDDTARRPQINVLLHQRVRSPCAILDVLRPRRVRPISRHTGSERWQTTALAR